MTPTNRFEHDPDEIVRLGGYDISLRDAVSRIMAIAPRPHLVTLFRDRGKEPSILGWEEIEWLATLPAYAD